MQGIAELIVLICLLIAASNDFSKKRISNFYIILISFLGLLSGAFNQNVSVGFLLISAFFGFLGGLFFYLLKLMGAADVKLAAALGLLGGGWVLAVSWLVSVPVVIAAGVYYKAKQVNGNRSGQYKAGVSRRIVPFGGIWIICFLMVWIYVKASAYDI